MMFLINTPFISIPVAANDLRVTIVITISLYYYCLFNNINQY